MDFYIKRIRMTLEGLENNVQQLVYVGENEQNSIVSILEGSTNQTAKARMNTVNRCLDEVLSRCTQAIEVIDSLERRLEQEEQQEQQETGGNYGF